jgi:hypothetical protein
MKTQEVEGNSTASRQEARRLVPARGWLSGIADSIPRIKRLVGGWFDRTPRLKQRIRRMLADSRRARASALREEGGDAERSGLPARAREALRALERERSARNRAG